MDLRSWTWIHIALATSGYWVVVGGAWWIYTTRPARRERARRGAQMQALPGSRPGEQVLVLSGTINMARVLAALLGPPVLLMIVWWALRR